MTAHEWSAFFLGVLAMALLMSGGRLLLLWHERRSRIFAAQWRHRRNVVVSSGRWPEGQFGDL
jgi:hypothetical protein